ncbi:MAG: zf-TFIIB domain-containing protein [Polyangiaceae bacterium]
MGEASVCLGCGLPVESEDGGPACACPPPMGPPSSRGRDPYRALPEAASCPRCRGTIVERMLHDVMALECSLCLGLYLGADVVRRIVSPEGHDVRLAFPRRPRVPEPAPVQYIPCLVCQRPMNRTVFAKVSGVIVDVCKDHGVWFDAGEINAIIQFVEEGGMARAERRIAEQKAADSKRFAAQRLEAHRADVQSHYQRFGHAPPLDPALRDLFDGWW